MRLRLLLLPWIVQCLYIQTACDPKSESSETHADAVARRVLGEAVPYQNQALTAPEKAAVIDSLLATRALAWKVFAQVAASQAISITRPDDSRIAATMPQAFTWYSPEDMQRLMRLSYAAADPADLQTGTPLSAELFQTSEDQLALELTSMPTPLQRKWQKYLNEHPQPTEADLLGLAGYNRTLFSPDLAGSVIRRYADLQDCFPKGKKPAPDQAYRNCWQEPLPASSVMVKTAWLNARSDFRSFATDPDSLRSLMNTAGSSWAQHARTMPLPENIVRARNADQEFVLGGLHIVTKDLDDWLWISAFWSADPDRDFGSDRPDEVKALGAPWNQYKICAVSSYTQDPAELEKIAEKYPELAAVYRVVLENRGGSSWCSNPYIEQGVDNQRTNCIGCHQFAGTDIQQDKILADGARFPRQGSSKQRQDFPSDYIWAATQGPMGWLSLIDTHLLNRRNQP